MPAADPDPDARLTHVDAQGRARMVDVADKVATDRSASARARVDLGDDLLGRLLRGDLPKGEALAVARVAGIQAAKETARLIPLCHSLALSSVQVDFATAAPGCLEIRAQARCTGPTGVEMEALCAASVAALTVYDMCKALKRDIRIHSIELLEKTGGRSGSWSLPDEEASS